MTPSMVRPKSLSDGWKSFCGEDFRAQEVRRSYRRAPVKSTEAGAQQSRPRGRQQHLEGDVETQPDPSGDDPAPPSLGARPSARQSRQQRLGQDDPEDDE